MVKCLIFFFMMFQYWYYFCGILASFVYECEEKEFDCRNGFCIEAAYRCDRQEDCDNGIDELDCGMLFCCV